VEERHRHFGCRDEIQRPATFGLRGLEELVLEFRELAGGHHGLRVHEVRHPDLAVAVLLSVEVQHELGERALEARPRTPQDHESRLSDLSSALKVQNSELLPQLPVKLRGKSEPARLAPPAHLAILLLPANRHARMGHVRELEKQGLNLVLDLSNLRVLLLDFVGQLPHARDLRGRVFPPALGLSNLLAGLVSQRLGGLHGRDPAPAVRVKPQKPLQGLVPSPTLEGPGDLLRVFTNELEIQPGVNK
jgi:hypothetical protein